MGPLLEAVCAHDAARKTDGQLLQQFLARRDEAAFAALVRRHGAMVLGVCHRVLHNAADAEDAFQATFLVLAHKAPALATRAVLGDWLHGVAQRTALNARRAAARRRVKEQALARPAVQAEAVRNDWLPLLDEELCRLPQKYRLPIVLCDLEGQTRREAAGQLGWPEGTVAVRLARGRALLAQRVLRSAQLLSAALPAVLAEGSAQAAPPGLVHVTVQAALLATAGKGPAQAALSAEALGLAQGVLQSMFWNKMKIAALVVLLTLVFASVGGLTFHALANPGQPQPAEAAAPQGPAGAPVPAAQPLQQEQAALQGKGKAEGDKMPKVAWYGHSKDLKVSTLSIALDPAAKVVRTKTGLMLPVTITNQSSEAITVRLAHEWHGGEWPTTDLYASVTPDRAAKARSFVSVYLMGENEGKATEKTVLPAGKSLTVELRLDWPGTGSVPTTPLMEPAAQGVYEVRLLLVFEANGMAQYVAGPARQVELPPAAPSVVKGLSARIVVTSPLPLQLPEELKTELVLTNESDKSLRIGTLCSRIIETSPGWIETTLRPDFWQGAGPAESEMARHVATLQPGQSVSLPNPLGGGVRGVDGKYRIEAAYQIREDFAKKHGTWMGRVEARSVVIAVDPPIGPFVRELRLDGFQATGPPGDVMKPIIITSQQEVAKAFPVELWQARILGQGTSEKSELDFGSEKLLFFAWVGAADDQLLLKVEREQGKPVVVFRFIPGVQDDKKRHYHLFAVAREADNRVDRVAITAPPKAKDEEAAWSKAVNGLQARLSFAHAKPINGTPVITTYLELRNVSSSGNVMQIPLDLEKIQFKVTDEAGKVVPPANGPFDGISVKPGVLRLPFDSTLRINIASTGAGIPADHAGHLDLGVAYNWHFKKGDPGPYYLQATINVAPGADQQWSGTLQTSQVRIPIGKQP
jgi:RNA polymerase sigma factor (sigma-70 family)